MRHLVEKNNKPFQFNNRNLLIKQKEKKKQMENSDPGRWTEN